MNNTISTSLQNWIPYQLFFEDGVGCCRWLNVEGKEFTEPFFDDTIRKCISLRSYQNQIKCVSTIDILAEWAEHITSIQPTALIFHVSRCGSTTMSQLLALNKENIVLSEVPFFDELMRWKRKTAPGGEETSSQLLRSAIAFYAAQRNPSQQRLFIKTDSWHIFFYKQLRKMFPETPFIFLYRRPDEVIRSHQKRRGMQAVPGIIEPEIFGFDKDDILQIPLDEYMAMVLERYYQSFLEIAKDDKLSILVNYDEGAIALVKKIADTSGFSLTENDMEQMQERRRYHGKYPGELFSEEVIQSPVPGYLKKAMDLYEALEKMRNSAKVYVGQ